MSNVSKRSTRFEGITSATIKRLQWLTHVSYASSSFQHPLYFLLLKFCISSQRKKTKPKTFGRKHNNNIFILAKSIDLEAIHKRVFLLIYQRQGGRSRIIYIFIFRREETHIDSTSVARIVSIPRKSLPP